MSVEYDDYLAEHIGNVNRGLHWMLDNLPLNQEQIRNLEKALTYSHDESKFDKEEYEPYDEYFYGDNQSYGVVNNFNYAWLHHIHRNPHHWQYWILMEDDPEGEAPWKRLVWPGTGEYKAALTNMPVMPLEIPLSYIYEMVADWWTFSWKNNNLLEIFSWYGSHREKQIIHPSSRAILEYILKKMWTVLALSAVCKGADKTDLEKQYISYWLESPRPEIEPEIRIEPVNISPHVEFGHSNIGGYPDKIVFKPSDYGPDEIILESAKVGNDYFEHHETLSDDI